MSVFDGIEQSLNQALGLRTRAGSGARLRRELDRLRQEQGLRAEEVLRRLEDDPRLLRRLACALTVEETFFFRHPQHFTWLVEHAQRWLAKTEHPFSIWSAGCASGEEPYSMVIALHRALGSEGLARISILATDVDERVLHRARQGVYNAWSFRGTSPRALGAYLESRSGVDGYRLKPVVREAVRFEHLSMQEQLASLPPGALDVIFFRNVAIYMTEEAVASLYAGFVRVLKPGGMLVLGPADPLPADGAFVRSRVHDMLVHHKALPGASPKPRPLAEASRPPRAPQTPSMTPVKRLPASPNAGPAARAPRAVLAEVHRLADRGLTREALAALSEQLERCGLSPGLLGLRGRIHLAKGDAGRGAEDLKAALELAPGDSALRFHYALALEALHDCGACHAQVRLLLQNLEARSDAEALEPEAPPSEGGVTTVGSLRRAAHELLRRVE